MGQHNSQGSSQANLCDNERRVRLVEHVVQLGYKRVTMVFGQIELSHISVDKKNRLDVTFVFFISLLLVAQHVSGNHVPIIRS